MASIWNIQAVQETRDEQREGTPISSPEKEKVVTFGSQYSLTCPLCLKALKQPKQLESCFHIFCASCIKPYITDIQNGQKIKCPTCEKMSSCPEDALAWLSSDIYLDVSPGSISTFTESGNISCSNPSHTGSFITATRFCLECGKNFCSNCYSDHVDNDDFKTHHSLPLFKAEDTWTVSKKIRSTGATVVEDEEEADNQAPTGKLQCPVCRSTDDCEHLHSIHELKQINGHQVETCYIPAHAPSNQLVAYCTECEEPICMYCSNIEHKKHDTINIDKAKEKKKRSLEEWKEELYTWKQIFHDAFLRVVAAERNFKQHILDIQREMSERKAKVQLDVEYAFNQACMIVKNTGDKQAELNQQSKEMFMEEEFFTVVIELVEKALETTSTDIEVVRVWKAVSFLIESMGKESEKKNAKVTDPVLPQEIKEKCLVLPSPNCINPDLTMLSRVGVESTVLELCCKPLKVDEVLQFFSILPQSDTEALVSCKTSAVCSAVVKYSTEMQNCYDFPLGEPGEYCMVAVPGKGIVATLYQPDRSDGRMGRKQILFWDGALDQSMEEFKKMGTGGKVQVLKNTDLPPRGIAVTQENHLVVCMAIDSMDGDTAQRKSKIMLMTLLGHTLKEVDGSKFGISFPRYVTVNINGDICITDATTHRVLVLDGNLKLVSNPYVQKISNPYTDENRNRKFKPMGICHDKYGRLLVADPTNYTVLRIELPMSSSEEPKIKPLLEYKNVNNLQDPLLVALGQGPYLWVVFRDQILVYYYMDEESI